MSTQYTDGSWSDIKPLNEAFKEFLDAVNDGTGRAFHVGTKEDLEERQREADVYDRLSALVARVEVLEDRDRDSEALVKRATVQEIERFSKG